jgi:hypothetical protein
VTVPNQDEPVDRPAPEALGPLVPPPPTSGAGQQYQQPASQQYPAAPGPGFPPPPGTQYGSVQYGAEQYGSGQYGGQPSAGPYGGGAYYAAGPYGPGPYGYPQGYYGQQQGTSGLAIASLVLGICGFLCVTPFVGIGLGIGALTKIGRTGQPGKGMAIAGIILSCAWIALMVLLLVNGHIDSGAGSGTSSGSDGTNA